MIRRFSISLVLLIMMGLARCTAQDVVKAKVLWGVVTDTGGKPLKNAALRSYPCDPKDRAGTMDAGYRTFSDENGKFSFVRWNHEQRTCVSASAQGYLFQDFEVKFAANAGTLKFVLYSLRPTLEK